MATEARFIALARRFWAGLDQLSARERVTGSIDVLGTLYAAPLAGAGLLWLALATESSQLLQAAPTLILLFGLLWLLHRLNFFIFFEVRPGVFADFSASLSSIIVWSAALIFGPAAIWLSVIWHIGAAGRGWSQNLEAPLRWNLVRNFSLSLARDTLISLLALSLYQTWGGAFPLADLNWVHLMPALLATLVRSAGSILVWLPMLWFYRQTEVFTSAKGTPWAQSFTSFNLLFVAWPLLTEPFAVLAAGLYGAVNLPVYLFFITGAILVSLIAHQFSRVVERSRQRERELENLEKLGRDLAAAPADLAAVAAILQAQLPALFPFCQLEIRLLPDEVLAHYPDDTFAANALVWRWLAEKGEARYFPAGADLPWDPLPAGQGIVVVPIHDMSDETVQGGLYLSQRPGPLSAAHLQPAAQTVAIQLATVLNRFQTHEQALAYQAELYQKEIYAQAYQAEIYAQALEFEKVSRELSLAGRIQASFLPRQLPTLPGWQMSVTLEPARETSGDFYDFIPLADGRLGIVIADVADKGMGAALYMALSRTLIRTYAFEYADAPSRALAAANARIMADTESDMFVTVFYGILTPATGELTYCNAGHNPPLLISGQNGHEPQSLAGTGLPLGVLPDAEWAQAVVTLDSGDLLVLYTDGVTEAQDEDEAFFGAERLIQIVRRHVNRPVALIESKILGALDQFVGDAPQFDDISLLLLARQAGSSA